MTYHIYQMRSSLTPGEIVFLARPVGGITIACTAAATVEKCEENLRKHLATPEETVVRILNVEEGAA